MAEAEALAAGARMQQGSRGAATAAAAAASRAAAVCFMYGPDIGLAFCLSESWRPVNIYQLLGFICDELLRFIQACIGGIILSSIINRSIGGSRAEKESAASPGIYTTTRHHVIETYQSEQNKLLLQRLRGGSLLQQQLLNCAPIDAIINFVICVQASNIKVDILVVVVVIIVVVNND